GDLHARRERRVAARVETGDCSGATRRRGNVWDARRPFPPHPLHQRRCDGGRIPNSGDPAAVDLKLPVSRGGSSLTWIHAWRCRPCPPGCGDADLRWRLAGGGAGKSPSSTGGAAGRSPGAGCGEVGPNPQHCKGRIHLPPTRGPRRPPWRVSGGRRAAGGGSPVGIRRRLHGVHPKSLRISAAGPRTLHILVSTEQKLRRPLSSPFCRRRTTRARSPSHHHLPPSGRVPATPSIALSVQIRGMAGLVLGFHWLGLHLSPTSRCHGAGALHCKLPLLHPCLVLPRTLALSIPSATLEIPRIWKSHAL
ncbi:unnamed protein product, partial [Urochloa humidicola]